MAFGKFCFIALSSVSKTKKVDIKMVSLAQEINCVLIKNLQMAEIILHKNRILSCIMCFPVRIYFHGSKYLQSSVTSKSDET